MDTLSLRISKTAENLRPAVIATSLEDMLRFERLLANLSAQFISLPSSEVDAAIDEALRRVVQALDLDRSTLSLFRSEDDVYYGVHTWIRNEPLPVSVGELSSKYPWLVSRIRSGEDIVFSSLDELPAQAHIDRASFERVGIRSHVSVALNVGGRIVGGVGFGMIRHQRTWPEDLLMQLRLVAEIIGNALARKRSQEAFEELLGFENLRADIAATGLPLPDGEAGPAIERGLQRIAEFLGLDRATLWNIESDGASLRPTRSWIAAGVPAPVIGIAVAMPWMSAKIRANEAVCIGNLDELPAEAKAEKEKLAALRTRSALMVPLNVGGVIASALSLATIRGAREWPNALVSRIRLLGEVFAAALQVENDRATLAHMARVSVLGQLSASIAHQLNQPLTAILTNAETAQRMLARDRIDIAELREISDDIVSESNRAADVIARLRALFKRSELQLQLVDLNALVQETLDLARTDLVLRQITPVADLSPSMPPVDGDRVQLQQVLLNLIVNAAEAMTGADGQRQLTIHTDMSGADAKLSVSDSGPGIQPDKLKHVFEPFWSTKPGGMGMGLALCRSIIAAHGGSLTAGNHAGGGAIFCATLHTQSA